MLAARAPQAKILGSCTATVLCLTKYPGVVSLVPTGSQWDWSWNNKGSHHECEGGIRRSSICITRLGEWWQTVIARDAFFYPILTQILDYFSCSSRYISTAFYIGKTWKSLPENPESAYRRHSDVILALQWRHGSMCDQRAADVRLFVFYLSQGW